MKQLLIFVILTSSCVAISQDVVFTNFNASPLSLNPAMTGVFDGSLRIMANHRNQWENIINDSSYKSYSLSVDKKIKANENSYFGLGFLGITDVAGETRLGNKQGKLSFSYTHSIAQSRESNHYLIVGQNLGITKRQIDTTMLRWPSQVVDGVFDPGLPGEDIKSGFTHFDMATGLMWISRFKSNNSFYGGLALHHLNKSNVSFFDNGLEPLSIRLTFHAGGEFSLNNNMSIIPSFVYNKQRAHQLLNIGSEVRRYFSTGQNFADIQVRYLIGKNHPEDIIMANAMAFQVRSYIKGISCGFSYEKTLNELMRASSFEFSLGYTIENDLGPKLMPMF